MTDLRNFKESKPVLETVMGELEQRYLEISSLLESSEKSRADMEIMLKEQNNELITLRANTLIMQTLENEVNTLNTVKMELANKVKLYEEEIISYRKEQNTLLQKIHEIETEEAKAANIYQTKVLDLSKKLSWTQNQMAEKDQIIAKTEQTVKELFEKCQQLGISKKDIKMELIQCVDSGNQIKDMNKKLQYCRKYLEEQIDRLVKELRNQQSSKEELKGEMDDLRSEIRNRNTKYEKQITLLNEEKVRNNNNVSCLKEELEKMSKLLKGYESGETKSASVINEIKNMQELHDNVKKSLQERIENLQFENEKQKEELKNYVIQNRRVELDTNKMQSQVKYYEEYYIMKEEAERMKNELEITYKLEMNSQLQKVSAVFQEEQDELLKTMRASMSARKELELDVIPNRPNSKLQNFNNFLDEL